LAGIPFSEVNEDILKPLAPPKRMYWVVMGFLVTGILWAVFCWIYQVEAGMGVTGLNIPVGWGVYITNFVFWVGIAHSGTLISAILHLVRSRWRTAIARASEAMTVFAVITAGLFPLIHLGRVWVFYFILPYPSERQLWPNFISPLVWDVCAVSTYLTVSSIFWYVGLWPDLAAARDRSARLLGPDHPRTRLYRWFSLGWHGSGEQWRHYGRGYLFFAALATPLVISVHSVVSWDFAMAQLAGWHTTVFAPYFVAGAIHSGLAMVLVLVIPMRKILHLHRVIDIEHFDAMAQTMIVTTCIVGYAYLLEPFIAWYSGDLVEKQFAVWRATGPIAPLYWALWVCNVAVPLAFLTKWARRHLGALFVVGILVNVGMWLERFVIIVGSLWHDFLPHNWGGYFPSWVEISITLGSFCWFFFWFYAFTKTVPTVSLADVKADEVHEVPHGRELVPEGAPAPDTRGATTGVLAVFKDRLAMMAALRKVRESSFRRIDTYSPVRLREAEAILGRGRSPVRFWTLLGALTGFAGGFALAIGSALVNGLIVGGKHPVSIVPYCIVGFEGTILLGTLGNLTGVLVNSRLGRPQLPPEYDARFSSDCYGIFVACEAQELPAAARMLGAAKPDEVRTIRPVM